MPMHWLRLGFWGNVCNPRFITSDYADQKLVAVITVSLQKCQCWLNGLCFVFRRHLLSSVHSKRCHRPHFTVCESCNKSLQFQPLQRCSYERSGSTASACVILRHYYMTYKQSLHAINGLLVVWRLGNTFFGRPSYISSQSLNVKLLLNISWNLSRKFLLSSDIRSEASITNVKKFDFDFFMIFEFTSLPESKNVF